jgi:hypothetical protein
MFELSFSTPSDVPSPVQATLPTSFAVWRTLVADGGVFEDGGKLAREEEVISVAG